MKITAITIENFKGISEPVRVELKPITLLFGANSVGKSTIVQALHYVREILERNNVDADRCLGADESLDLGGFKNLVHNHDLSKSIRIRIEMSMNDYEFPDYMVLNEGPASTQGISERHYSFTAISFFWVELKIEHGRIRRPYVSSYSVGFHNEPFARIVCDDMGRTARIAALDIQHSSIKEAGGFLSGTDVLSNLFNEIFIGNEFAVDQPNGLTLDEQKTAVPKWGHALTFPWSTYEKAYERAEEMDEAVGGNSVQHQQALNGNKAEFEGYLSQLIVGPGELLLEALKKMRYIGPIRKIPARDYTPPRYSDESRWASGLAAWDLLFKASPKLLADTSDWLSAKEKLNSGYSIRTYNYKKLDMAGDLYKTLLAKGVKGKAAIADLIEHLPEEKQVLLTDERSKLIPKLDVRPQDVGIGISQILPVVVGALDDGTGILMVEQPELHIHPALQTSLGDLFLSQVQNEGKTFIIETHSEHLLLRLMRRMRESHRSKDDSGSSPAVTPLTVGVWYVEQYDSKTVVREMPLNKRGELVKAWPGGFFEEGLREVL
jgi:predicted ATPase